MLQQLARQRKTVFPGVPVRKNSASSSSSVSDVMPKAQHFFTRQHG
jgi:hypothetical protein